MDILFFRTELEKLGEIQELYKFRNSEVFRYSFFFYCFMFVLIHCAIDRYLAILKENLFASRFPGIKKIYF